MIFGTNGAALALPVMKSEIETTDAVSEKRIRIVLQCTREAFIPPIMTEGKNGYRKTKNISFNLFLLHTDFHRCTFVHVNCWRFCGATSAPARDLLYSHSPSAMFSLNRIDIIGYQTQPVTVRQTPSGASVTDLNIVVPYSFQSSKGETLSGKSFHTVTVWGAMADVAGQYVKPGSQLFISGRLQTDSWDDTTSGEKKNKTKVVAMDLILLDPKDGQRDVPSGAESLANCVNRAQVVGNVTREPEMRTTTSGQSVLTLGVATNEKWKEKATGELKERSEFHNVVIWGDTAKAVQAGVKKGQRVYVTGRVQTRTWETPEGKKRATTEIIADQVTLLGMKNSEAMSNIQSEGVSMPSAPSRSSATAEATPVAAGMPDIKYESEIKPEDLPF